MTESNKPQPTYPEKTAAFRKKLEDGNYRELFGEKLNSIFTQATNQLDEIGMAEEIGSLRYVLAKVLAEESDLNRMATNVARIVGITIRAVQTHNLTLNKADAEFVKMLEGLLDDAGIDPADDTIPAT